MTQNRREGSHRIKRLNVLLKEVITEAIYEMKNRHLPSVITVTDVEVAKDLRTAKVFISLLGTEQEQKKILSILQEAHGFIGMTASKKVTLRYFPKLFFYLDKSLEKQMNLEVLMLRIQEEREKRS